MSEIKTIIINRGPAGTPGASGATTYAALTDKATVSLPTINTPLASALAGKAPLQAPTTAGIEFKNSAGVSLLRIGKYDATTGVLKGVAMGEESTASGANSLASGSVATASGSCSFAVGASTTASGDYSIAVGYYTTASGLASHAVGNSTTASGVSSHAAGNSTTASGVSSHAAGTYAKAIHDGARVMTDGQTVDCESTAADECTLRYQNGYRFLGGSAVFTGTLTASNLSGTNTGDQTSVTGNSGTTTAALGIKSASTTVSVSTAAAPTSGQVLTATGGSAATWQTPSGTTYTAGTGLTLTGSVFSVTAGTYAPARSIQTTSFTAAVGGRYTLYNTGGVASITDPTGTAAGQSYTVIMAAGTAQFNGAGTVFGASRFELVRSYNGSSWGTLSPLLSDALAVGANTWDGSIISGPQSFSSATRPTSTGTGAPAATSLITAADGDSRYQSNVSVRDLFPCMSAIAIGAAGSTIQGTPSDGIVGGYFGAGSGNTTGIRINLCSRALMGGFTEDRIIYSRPWSLHTRHLINLASNTTQYMVLGGNGDSGIPSTNGSVGFEITSTTTVRIWANATASGRTNSSDGTISGINATGASPHMTGEHYFWLDCNGLGTLSLFWAYRPFESAMPLKPVNPICTLATGVPTTITSAVAYADSGSTGYGKCQYYMRASAAPGALFVQNGIRAAKLTEY